MLYSRAYLPNLGGIEQATHLLARELARAGLQVTVATDVLAPSAFDQEFGFAVLRGASVRELVQCAGRHDLVHSNGFSLVAAQLALRAGRPLVYTHAGYQAVCFEGSGWHEGVSCEFQFSRCFLETAKTRGMRRAIRQALRHPMGRIALHAAAFNVSVSRAVACKIEAPRSEVIYNCADVELFRPGVVAGGRDKFLFVGRFVGEKGVEVVLRALALERASGRIWPIDLVGSGPLQSRYSALARELGIESQVYFRGPLRGEELAQAFRDCLAVVVPSALPEPFGIVAAEAMACGRIALVSDHGGLSEVVEGMETAVTPNNPIAWAKALYRAASDSAWRDRVERGLGEAVRRFTPTRHVESYLEVYRRATTSSSARIF